MKVERNQFTAADHLMDLDIKAPPGGFFPNENYCEMEESAQLYSNKDEINDLILTRMDSFVKTGKCRTLL
jgi:hypothetical protein